MRAKRKKQDFKWKHNEMLAVARIGLGSYRENVAAFGAWKGKYTEEWGDDFETQLNEAIHLPNIQARGARAEELMVDLNRKNVELCEKWQGLKLYIADVPGWEKLQKPMLEAAGKNLYQKASRGNWAMTQALADAAMGFMQQHMAELVTPENMPGAFVTEFGELRSEFEGLFLDFTDACQDGVVGTAHRLDKLNAVYRRLIGMFADGYYIFRHNGAMQNRFVFVHVLAMLRGSGTPIRTVRVDAGSSRVLRRLVARSKVVNTGDVSLWVDAGETQRQSGKAVELRPEDRLDVPGPSVTLYNNDRHVAGEVQARMVVD
jgi:hypothetical protein